MSQASFAKRQREKERRERAAAKAAKREERKAQAEEAGPESDAPPIDEGALLAALADLHARFEDDQIDFDTFTEQKEQIVSRLQGA